MTGGLDNTSAEGLSSLSSKLNEVTKNLEKALKQQEALLKTTLEVEQKIIDTRVAGLKEYNDGYSRLLNNMSSELSLISAEMFKIAEAGDEAADNAEKAANAAKQAARKPSSGTEAGGKSVYQTSSDSKVSRLGDADSANAEALAGKYKVAKDNLISMEELEEAMHHREEERIKVIKAKEKEASQATLSLMMAKEQASGTSAMAEEARLNALRELELDNISAVTEAEQKAQDLINQMLTESAYASSPEAADLQIQQSEAIAKAAAMHELQKELDKEREEFIYQQRLAHNGEINAAELAAFNKQLALRYDSEEKLQEYVANYKKKQLEDEKKRREKEEEDARKKKKEEKDAAQTANIGILLGKDKTIQERKKAFDELDLSNKDVKSDLIKSIAGATLNAVGSAIKKLESQIDRIGENKGFIDTRLQGSSITTYKGSYWDQIQKDIIGVGAINPYFKQETFANKIKELVKSGIAFNLEQRAFLATISDKIANTFNVADATLLRLVRIQQQDSTAGRLGMESALNAFLNEMYENTEYLETVAAGVRTSLEEMQALMEGAAATEVEYQVQKWMGSLYSVGISQGAVTSITNALGQIAAGQIEGLTGDGAGNLLIMAANNAGVPIADILAKGLDADKTNELLQATVNYLAELAESSQDNQVVQQQLANVFGVKASDLRAATNLATKDSVGAIYDNSMSYDNMLGRLFSMAGSMGQRTSTGEFLSNLWSNITYSLAGGIASSPASYGIFKAATLLDNVAGGLAFSLPLVMGSGSAQTFKIADILRVASLGGGIISSMGDLLSGLSNSFSGQKMLAELGIEQGSGLAITPRGDGLGLLSQGGGVKTTSSSGYVGNAAASDVKNSTIKQTEDSVNQQVIEAQENAEATQIDTINATILKIYELLDEVASGKSSFNVKVEGYGLTRAGNSGSSIGGVNALDSLSSNNQSSSSKGLSSGGVNSGGLGGSVSLSGWTTTM